MIGYRKFNILDFLSQPSIVLRSVIAMTIMTGPGQHAKVPAL